MDKGKLYQSLYMAYCSAYPYKTKKICQDEFNKKWTELKKDGSQLDAEHYLKELKSMESKRKASLHAFWGKQASVRSTRNDDVAENTPSGTQREEPSPSLDLNQQAAQPLPSTSKSIVSTKIPVAQLKLQSEIDVLNADLVGLHERKRRGMLTDIQEKELKDYTRKKNELEINLNKTKNSQIRSQKYRSEKKRILNEVLAENPELRKKIKIREVLGRPRIEDEQPQLLQAIINIAMHGSASHQRRRSEVYRSIKTLDELTKAMNNNGFHISRSGLYIRLQPKRSTSLEGQRHVNTVPVKLLRAHNDHHVRHVDGPFCTATIAHLEELASVFGPNEVCFISQDDKARVPIGLAAANKQTPLLMHLEYKVRLPDHDWVVAAQHKLIPSVYAGIKILPNGLGKREAVGYSGPTYIAIRSGKHSSSTAFSHALDFEKLFELKEFDEITKIGNSNIVKPILILSVDGGPDENPRYQKVVRTAVYHFSKYDFDAVFIATNAPGRSAFNRVERRMAPLSKTLSGLILPYDHCGNHLNEKGETINVDLEKKNFEFAGQTLAEIWSETIFDSYPTVAEYIQPENSQISEQQLILKNQKWYAEHVRTSQYLTQIIKCSDVTCCSKPRSSYFNLIAERFLPPPIPLLQTAQGLRAADPTTKEDECNQYPSLFVALSLNQKNILPQTTFEKIPYDFYCPSIKKIIKNRVCNTCKMYFASYTLLRMHSEIHKKTILLQSIRPIRIVARRQRELMAIIAHEENGESVEWIDEDDLDLSEVIIPDENIPNTPLPVFSIEEHLKSAWED